MSQYKLEDCSAYQVDYLNGIPVVIFDSHNMALPVWGTFSHRNSCKYNLYTFDSHTDTNPAFNAYLAENGEGRKLGAEGLKTPVIRKLLKKYAFTPDNFNFEDIFQISCSYLKSSEQILTAYWFDYLCSYTVICRCTCAGYEREDKLNGLNARYIRAEEITNISFDKLPSTPIALDFDLDFFRNPNDMNPDFFHLISPLIQAASVITIAREPVYFENCKTDSNFTNNEAEKILLERLGDVIQALPHLEPQ